MSIHAVKLETVQTQNNGDVGRMIQLRLQSCSDLFFEEEENDVDTAPICAAVFAGLYGVGIVTSANVQEQCQNIREKKHRA